MAPGTGAMVCRPEASPDLLAEDLTAESTRGRRKIVSLISDIVLTKSLPFVAPEIGRTSRVGWSSSGRIGLS